MTLPKALKESVFVYLSFGLAVLYSIFAVLFASSWISEYNIFFAVLAAFYLAAYLTFVRFGTFQRSSEEYLYLSGILCFVMPVVYGIGQNDPLLIRENLSSVYFFIFFAAIITSLKAVCRNLFSVFPADSLPKAEETTMVSSNKLEQGQILKQDAVISGNSAVFRNSDVFGIGGLIFYQEGAQVPAGAELVAPAVVDLLPAEVGHKSKFSQDYEMYMQSVTSSIRALGQRYLLSLLLPFFGIIAILLMHFPYQTPGRLSLWFQLSGAVLFAIYLFRQFRMLFTLCLLLADRLYKSGCQISAFQKFLELLLKSQAFKFKLSGLAQHKILADIRIIDEQVDAAKLYELLFYLIADSRNSDFVQIRSHLDIRNVNSANLNIVQRRIETPYGIIAWMDNKKLILGNEAFIIQNGVFVNASEFLSVDNSDNIYFAIDQELLAGFILQNFSNEHLRQYAERLKKTVQVLIDNQQNNSREKNLGSYGLTVKATSVPVSNENDSEMQNYFKILFSESLFSAKEMADAYLPASGWYSVQKFFSLYEKARNLLFLNVALLAFIFLMIFLLSSLILLAQIFVLIAALFLFSRIFQQRYLSE